jgi:hypothetical protein
MHPAAHPCLRWSAASSSLFGRGCARWGLCASVCCYYRREPARRLTRLRSSSIGWNSRTASAATAGGAGEAGQFFVPGRVGHAAVGRCQHRLRAELLSAPARRISLSQFSTSHRRAAGGLEQRPECLGLGYSNLMVTTTSRHTRWTVSALDQRIQNGGYSNELAGSWREPVRLDADHHPRPRRLRDRLGRWQWRIAWLWQWHSKPGRASRCAD